jgi:DNA-binding MarR family transcriptional regulator
MPVRISLRDHIQDTWLIFHQTSDSITKCEDDTFAAVSLPYQQFIVMGAIKYAPAPVIPTVIANWLDRNPNSITLIIDRMEKDGLVKRVRDLKDRRRLRLIITEKGKKKQKQALKPSREIAKEILSVLSPEELATFATLLRKIREATFEYRNIKDKVLNVTPSDDNSTNESHTPT